MANRQLAYATDAEPTMHESGQEYMEGMWESVTIERSAAGQPGILIIMERRDGDLMEDQMCVTVKDGAAFLRPVMAWLHENCHPADYVIDLGENGPFSCPWCAHQLKLEATPRTIPTPTAATVAAFKKAWHDADAAGLTGARVEAGLIAALQELFGLKEEP